MASGNDKDLKIGITVDTAGADEAKRALEGVKKAGEDLGKGTAEGAKAAAEAKKLEQATKAVALSTELRAEAEKKLLENEELLKRVQGAKINANKQEEESLRDLANQIRLTEAAIRSQLEAVASNPTTGAINGLKGSLEFVGQNRADLDAIDAEMSARILPGTQGGADAAKETTEAVKQTTKAVEEQSEALEELSDAEAGVIRSTGKLTDEQKKLNEEAKKPDGFKALFDQQRMIQVGRLLGDLAREVGHFAVEFSKTEQGQEMMSKLTDETKVYGKTLSSVVAGAAEGFAVGGPIGAVVGGLTGAVKNFAEEYIDTQKRIEESNRQLAAAEAEHAKKSEERRKEAVRTDIEKQYQKELDKLNDQNEALDRQRGIRNAMRERDDATFDSGEEFLRGKGVSEDELKRRRIDYEEERDKKALEDDLKDAQKRFEALQVEVVAAKKKRDDIKDGALGTNNDDFKAADKNLIDLQEKERDAFEDFRAKVVINNAGIGTVATNAETKRSALAREVRERQKREEDEEAKVQARQAKERERDAENAQRAKKQEELNRHREELNDSARDASGKFSAAAGQLKSLGKAPELANKLGKIGVGLSDGADDKEIDRLAAEFKEATQGIQSATLGALQKMLEAQQQQAAEIRKLQGQVTKNVSPK